MRTRLLPMTFVLALVAVGGISSQTLAQEGPPDWIDDTSSADLELAYAAMYVAMDEALAAESRDEEWASRMEDQMRTYTAVSLPEATKLLAAKCGSTFCRFTLLFESRDARESFHDFAELPEVLQGEIWYYHRGEEYLELVTVRRGRVAPQVALPQMRPDDAIFDRLPHE